MMEVLGIIGLTLASFIIGVSDAVIGGGTLFTLALLTATGITPLQSVATVQIVTLFQNLSATACFIKNKMINWKLSIFWGLISAIGAYWGANLAIEADPQVFRYVITTIMIILFIFVVFEFEVIMKKVKLVEKKNVGNHLQIDNSSQFILLSIVSFVMGIYGGFYGAARGTLLLLFFFVISKKNIIKLAANSKIIDLVLSISSIYVFMSSGVTFLRLKYLVPICIGTIIGDYMGVDIAKKAGVKFLKYLIYIVMLAGVVRLIFF